MNSNVKVKVDFFNEVDSNLDIYTLRAKVRYSIPKVLGFIKYKELDIICVKDVTPQDWIKHVKEKMTETKLKSNIQKIIMEDIMSRIQKTHEKGEPEIMNRHLNQLSQLKFDFSINVDEAENIVATSNAVAFPSKEEEIDLMKL